MRPTVARSSLPTRSGSWRQRTRAAAPPVGAAPPIGAAPSSSSSDDDDMPTLWLIMQDGVLLRLHNTARGTKTDVPQFLRAGDIVEATLSTPDDAWAKLTPSEAARLLRNDTLAEDICLEEACLCVRDTDRVALFGGRTRLTGELWFARKPPLTDVVRHQPAPIAARAPVASLKKMATMEGHKVEAMPPLRHLEQSLTDDVIATLLERGYVVVDRALPAALCRKLKAEMEALEANGQMWNSQSYSSDDDGAPHPNIHETSLDYKEVRRYAPTFARMEHDPSLVERVRGVPGLEKLASQHVRIQINSGQGGCYTMHTDSGTVSGNSGQTLCLTALIYLNEAWKEGDGGELRVFPFPHPPEKIAPLQGRLVLFEPRMVHDVLPNHRKRFCFTLWCSQKLERVSAGVGVSNQIDHESMRKLELEPDLAVGAAHAAAWRGRVGRALPYDGGALPRMLRPLFLPEMRMMLVRVVHAAEELRQVEQSHEGGASHTKTMLDGISGMHEAIRRHNPAWLLELFSQLPDADAVPPHARGGGRLRLGELREWAHRAGPWWI